MSIVWNNVQRTTEVIQNSSATNSNMSSAQSRVQEARSQLLNAQSSLDSTASTSCSLQSQLSSTQSSLCHKQAESQRTDSQIAAVQHAVTEAQMLVQEEKKKFGEHMKEKVSQPQKPILVLKADVIGRDNIFKYFEALLRNDHRLFENFLFYGVKGVGKTYLANALAHLCGYHFKKMCLDDVNDLKDDQIIEYMGYVFENARTVLPCFILLEDFDAVLTRLASQETRKLLVSALLQQLDGMARKDRQMVAITMQNPAVLGAQRNAVFSRMHTAVYLDGASRDEKLAYVGRQIQTGKSGKFGLEWGADTNAQALARAVGCCPTYELLDFCMKKTKTLAASVGGVGVADVEIFHQAVNTTSSKDMKTEVYDEFVCTNNNCPDMEDL